MIHNSRLNIHRLFFYLLVLFLPTQLGYHFWPDWSLVLGRRIDYLSPTLFFTDILLVLMLAFWAIEKRHNMRLRTVWVSTTAILVLYAIFSVATSSIPQITAYWWVRFLECTLLVLYIKETKPKTGKTIVLLAASVLYSSVIALAQFIVQHTTGFLWVLGERVFNAGTPGIALFSACFPGVNGCPLFLRSYATFPHPNVLGGYIALLLPLFIGILLYTHNNRHNNTKTSFSILFYGTSVVLGTIALLATFSRSAWVAAVIGVGGLVYRLKSKHGKIGTTIAALFCLSAITLIVFSAAAPDTQSYELRKELNMAAVRMFIQHPFVGVGSGAFISNLPAVLPTQYYYLQPAHNIYFLLLAEVGLVGVALIALSVVSRLKVIVAFLNRDTKNTVVFLIRTSIFVILLIGLVDHYPVTIQQGRLLGSLLLGMWLSNDSG